MLHRFIHRKHTRRAEIIIDLKGSNDHREKTWGILELLVTKLWLRITNRIDSSLHNKAINHAAFISRGYQMPLRAPLRAHILVIKRYRNLRFLISCYARLKRPEKWANIVFFESLTPSFNNINLCFKIPRAHFTGFGVLLAIPFHTFRTESKCCSRRVAVFIMFVDNQDAKSPIKNVLKLTEDIARSGMPSPSQVPLSMFCFKIDLPKMFECPRTSDQPISEYRNLRCASTIANTTMLGEPLKDLY